MKILPLAFLLMAILLSGAYCPAQKATPSNVIVVSEDLRMLIGPWEGSLTYIDYSSGEPYTMPANLIIKAGKNDNELILQNVFPNEPHANSTGKMKRSKDGRKLNGNVLISKEIRSDGTLIITTLSKGKDNKKKALLRNIYVIGTDVFSMSKEVQFDGTETWLKRNEFTYDRASALE